MNRFMEQVNEAIRRFEQDPSTANKRKLRTAIRAMMTEYEVPIENLLAQAGQGELLDVLPDWED